MGRKAKYSKELKLEIVKRYLKGETVSYLANLYNVSNNHGTPILKWVHKYEVLGETAFEESSNNKSYSLLSLSIVGLILAIPLLTLIMLNLFLMELISGLSLLPFRVCLTI